MVYVKVVNYKPLITSHHAPSTTKFTFDSPLYDKKKLSLLISVYSSEDFEGQRNAVKTR